MKEVATAVRLLLALDPLVKAGPQTYGLSMISPEGEVHTCGGSHPDWCHDNRHLVGFEGTKNSDYEPATGDEATFDDNEQTALDHFKDAGWIRYKPNAGLEMSHVHPRNLPMIKKLLAGMGRQNPGRTLYVDSSQNNHRLAVDHRGRVDTSSLDQEAAADHY